MSGGDQPVIDTGGNQQQYEQQQPVVASILPREQAVSSNPPKSPPAYVKLIQTHTHTQISTAITFLQHQSVKRTSISQKQQFLRSKGLTEDEIQIACERAGCFSVDPNNQSTYINMGITAASPPPTTTTSLASILFGNGSLTALQRIKEILTSTALVAGISYVIYLFYKVRTSWWWWNWFRTIFK